MLRVYLLGSVHLEHDNVPLSRLPTQKAISLLGYLTTHASQAQPRDLLAELFWPERPPTHARRSLNTALWHIRHALKQSRLNPEEFLDASGNDVGWNAAADYWLDLSEFESVCATDTLEMLQRAVGLYRGPFLEGLYDNWCI
jgi:DNA-binding SARP family transcriptional activator